MFMMTQGRTNWIKAEVSISSIYLIQGEDQRGRFEQDIEVKKIKVSMIIFKVYKERIWNLSHTKKHAKINQSKTYHIQKKKTNLAD